MVANDGFRPKRTGLPVAAYVLDRTDRFLVWLISTIAAIEFAVEAIVSSIRGETNLVRVWASTAALVFGLATVAQTFKFRRGP